MVKENGELGGAGKKRKDREVGSVRMTIRIEESKHSRLASLSEQEGVTIAYILDLAIEKLLESRGGELIDINNEFKAAATEESLSEMRLELKRELGLKYEELGPESKKGLEYLGLFPYLSNKELMEVSGLTYDVVTRLRKTEVATEVVNRLGERHIWSRRPEFLQSLIERAIESRNPAFAQLAARFFGDEKQVISQRSVNYNVNTTVGGSGSASGPVTPQELDMEVIRLAERVNMTPKRFELLWSKQQQLLGTGGEVVEAEVVEF